MKHADFNEGLRRVLRAYSKHGYTLSVCFEADFTKVDSKAAQWAEQFGTNLLAYQKQDRRQRGLPTAVATCLPVLGLPHRRTLILMSTPHALRAPQASPWSRERWSDSPPRCAPYELVHTPRDRGDYSWTWRLDAAEMQRISKRLIDLVKTKNAESIRLETAIWIKCFSMQRGVRSQFAKLFRSARKLWQACHGLPWPGVDPDHLPFISQFRSTNQAPLLQ
jgi:hypothetical protein